MCSSCMQELSKNAHNPWALTFDPADQQLKTLMDSKLIQLVKQSHGDAWLTVIGFVADTYKPLEQKFQLIEHLTNMFHHISAHDFVRSSEVHVHEYLDCCNHASN
jgi:hypothetical protein